jgi:WD40 repeat protein
LTPFQGSHFYLILNVGWCNYSLKENILYNIPNDLIANIIKYIDFKRCSNLIKILKNTTELKEKINYINLNKYKQFEMELPINYKNKLCDDFNNINKKNECLKYVYNCYNNYKLIKTIKNDFESRSVTFNHDGTKIAHGSVINSLIYIWCINTGKYILKLEGHYGMVRDVLFNYNSTKIVSGSGDYNVILWDFPTGKMLLKLIGHSGAVISVGFNHNSTKIVSGSTDQEIRVWDIDENSKTYSKCIQKLEGHKSFVSFVSFNYNSTMIVSSDYSEIRTWNVKSGKCILKIKSRITKCKLNHDSTKIVCGSDNNTVKLWCIITGRLLKIFNGHTDDISSVDINHNSTKIVSGSYDNNIYLWDIYGNNTKSGKLMKVLTDHKDIIDSVRFNHDSTMIISGSEDNTIKIWENSFSKNLSNKNILNPNVKEWDT